MFKILTRPLRHCARLPRAAAARLHRDEQGSISIIAVFSVLLFAVLMAMVINVGRQVDGKVKMQNAADAATYSGGTVLARGMNGLAFSNRLLADVFALTAFLREARDRNAQSLVPDVLAAWEKIAPIFSGADFPKFRELGPAITEKIPLEQNLVDRYSNLAADVSAMTLPVFEEILRTRAIPEFQRSLVRTIPELAQQATEEIARRHGLTQVAGRPRGLSKRGNMTAVLWRTSVIPVAVYLEDDPYNRTLPVIDPVRDSLSGSQRQFYLEESKRQRERLAHWYLNEYVESWNTVYLDVFDVEAKMSQFGNLWRIFTCGQLDKLLNEEYPQTNLFHVIRRSYDDPQTMLERDYMFVGVAYWSRLNETFPGLFRTPINGDSLTYSQVSLFVPRPPRRYSGLVKRTGGVRFATTGGFPGSQVDLPAPTDGEGEITTTVEWRWRSLGWPTDWSLLNQHWHVKLVPATADLLPEILQSNPGGDAGQFQLPNLGTLDNSQLQRINTH